MSSDAIGPPSDSPDAFGVGAVTCPCGLTKMWNVKGHRALTLTTRCPTCGGTCEVAPDVE